MMMVAKEDLRLACISLLPPFSMKKDKNQPFNSIKYDFLRTSPIFPKRYEKDDYVIKNTIRDSHKVRMFMKIALCRVFLTNLQLDVDILIKPLKYPQHCQQTVSNSHLRVGVISKCHITAIVCPPHHVIM
jgi:hypothetical protein